MYVKSPIFYMGNKYDLLDDMLQYFPKKEKVNKFIDLFGGSGVVSANVDYDNIVYNEINENVFNLFKMLNDLSPDEIISHIENNIEKFKLYNKTTDTRNINDIKIREEAQIKFNNFRKYYNKTRNVLDLFTLTYFSFSNQMRFNYSGEFNMPFGNRCFIFNDHDIEIKRFHNLIKDKNITLSNNNAFHILKDIKVNDGEFIYLDPPYSNTTAVYNEQRAGGGWTIDDDLKLFDELDRLDEIGVKWAMSNVFKHKGKVNAHIKEWALKRNYEVIYFDDKVYSALGKGNADTEEVFIINYEAPFKQYDIFDFLGDD